MVITGFKKFDPHEFLESERLAPRCCERADQENKGSTPPDLQTLASLATLAASETNCGLSQNSRYQIHEGNERNKGPCETAIPAKVAKVLKLAPTTHGLPDE